MKTLLVCISCMILIGCADKIQLEPQKSLQEIVQPKTIISKDDLQDTGTPFFELLPGQEDLENNKKQIRAIYPNGYTGLVSLEDGYKKLAQFLYTIAYNTTQFNAVVNLLIQIYEADLGLEVEPPPFLEIRKTVPYLHRIGK